MPILGRDELWELLVEAVHSLPMYKSHKRYVEEMMLKETPQISPQELAVELNIPRGEAIVLLDEIRGGQTPRDSLKSNSQGPKPADRSLLEFDK